MALGSLHGFAPLVVTSFLFVHRCPKRLKSVLSLENDELVLELSSRKNKQKGSTMRRSCWCATCTSTCPVHVLWPFFASQGVGAQPFVAFTPGFALRALRILLFRLKVPNAGRYRTHDIRRGHTQDLVDNGASLAQILSAGQWKSPAFLQYVNLDDLERDAVVEAHMEESSSDDEGPDTARTL